jgi:nucleolar protein 56
MPRHLVTTWYGAFLLDGDGAVLASRPFPRDVEGIARRLDAIRSGELLDEEAELATQEGELLVAEPRQLELPGAVALPQGVAAPQPPPSTSLGFQVDLLRRASLAHATKAVKEALPPDQPVMLLLRAMDLLERRASPQMELLRYRYGFHFPELGALVDEPTMLGLLGEGPDRGAIIAAHPGLDPGTEPGRPLRGSEAQALQELASDVGRARRGALDMRAVLEREMVEAAPNVTVLAGALVGARLISIAGSLERLSRFPSSTVQLLGAERALFLHLSERAPAPKHGVLFQHHSVHSAPPWLRGRVARTLAGKVCIAARADAAGTHPDGGLGRELREDFLSRVQRLRARHPQPPPGWRDRRAQRERETARRQQRQRGRPRERRPQHHRKGGDRRPGTAPYRSDRPGEGEKVWRARERRRDGR